MNRNKLIELIDQGESSTLEFKRDSPVIQGLAKELVAFLNLEGGTILMGVEDDGSISGTRRARIEEWVAEACRVKIEPPVVPLLSWVRNAEPGRDVLVVGVPAGPDKPYARVHNHRRTYYIRVGSTSRKRARTSWAGCSRPRDGCATERSRFPERASTASIAGGCGTT